MFEKPINTNLKENEYGCRVHSNNLPPMDVPDIGASKEDLAKKNAAYAPTDDVSVRLTQNYKNARAKLIEDGKNRWRKE